VIDLMNYLVISTRPDRQIDPDIDQQIKKSSVHAIDHRLTTSPDHKIL
jgi:hypothetical protein